MERSSWIAEALVSTTNDVGAFTAAEPTVAGEEPS